MSSDKPVTFELSRDHAIILMDWIVRFNAAPANLFEDQAEQRVLWDLECTLETLLEEIFDPKYREIVAAARDRVRDRVEPDDPSGAPYR